MAVLQNTGTAVAVGTAVAHILQSTVADTVGPVAHILQSTVADTFGPVAHTLQSTVADTVVPAAHTLQGTVAADSCCLGRGLPRTGQWTCSVLRSTDL